MDHQLDQLGQPVCLRRLGMKKRINIYEARTHRSGVIKQVKVVSE